MTDHTLIDIPSVSISNTGVVSNIETEWSNDIIHLLKKWQLDIEHNKIIHNTKGLTFHRIYYIINIFLCVVQVGVVSSILNAIFLEKSQIVLIIVAGIEGFVVIIQSIYTFINPSSVASQHFEAAKQYMALYNLIDAMLALPVASRDDTRTFVNNIRTQFNEIVKNSPTLSFMPQKHVEKYTQKECKFDISLQNQYTCVKRDFHIHNQLDYEIDRLEHA